ncbi:peptidase domain-containing ABC transporter [Winslowiella iniecta]|uniref:ABC-type xenobiotic transporter n=1 Tax=Winslowiella iniecta TaxID=1560201 RepID=A0A0L7T1T5_9GAMM|nr:peptidase domain-containing ABC transporter [Winslowiella iniecta]KOC89265.1 colicin V synthesis protein [Winslowiella iniecta]KOC94833.1 colicin V synthesis protein [Winslowiella iniecta]
MDNGNLEWLRSRLNFSLRRRVPLILQTEATECGLACIAMVGGWYGRYTDIISLRAEFGVSSRGATLGMLHNIATGNGLASRALSLELDELSKLRLPCILHWGFNHFVVLVRATSDRFVIHDPATGQRIISRKMLSQHFTGVALELWPDSGFVAEVRRKTLRISELMAGISGFRRALIKVFCFSLMTEFISLLLPVSTQVVMDHVIPAADHGLLELVCFALLGLILLQAALNLVRSWSVMITDTLTDIQWKDGLLRHLLRLPLPWFEKRKLGDVQSRFGSLDVLRDTLIHDITGTVIDSIMMAGALVLLILYGGMLSAVVVVFTLLYVILRLGTFARYRQLAEEQLIKSATASSHFTESLYGIATLRAQGLAGQRRRNWLTLTVDAANASVTKRRFDMLFNSISVLIKACDNVVILWLGISAIIGHQMTIGAFVAFTVFRELFTDRALSLTHMLLRLRMLSLHNERIADIALTTPEPDVPEKELFPPGKALSLKVHSLSFRYDSQSSPVFHGLNLSIAAGESVAVTGPSGCGKSTLMKVLCGLTAPEEGRVLVDGRDIHVAGVSNYRRAVACILQEDRLFAGSLRDNIAGFNDEVDEPWLESCARLSHIHDDIMALPMGYETLTGELGEGLSGGQRQRIFIARALYRRPGILFMDEATSHLDEENEALINQAINGLAITRIIIAHRPSTIASAERVINIAAH